MKNIFIALLVITSISTAHAYDYKTTNNNTTTCSGTESYRTCIDNSTGNSYSISKYGNTTHVDAYNSRTGSSWNQTTNNYGTTSQTYGSDQNGNSWNHNTQKVGESTYYNGNNSNGNSYNGSCNPYSGCYTNRN